MAKAIIHHNPEEDSTVVFGFWVYLMTDCVLFACLFATFAVLRANTFGGVSGHDIFQLPKVLQETLLLLTSSFTCGLAVLAGHKGKKNQVLSWLAATFLLGAGFLSIELSEFHHLILDGHGPSGSGFLSSFFTLVGTHGAHISVGLLWILVMMALIWKRGLSGTTPRRLMTFSLFWHFLDIVWIFIFTIVYLMGVMS